MRSLVEQPSLQLAREFDPAWLISGIRLSDEYFVRVRSSAGHRDWQKDFAQTATPTLVGLARSLERSADAQALIMQLCDSIAERLRLVLQWPANADEFNDLANEIYLASLEANHLEDDHVLIALKGLTVFGPR